jgi:N-methylhydantoinase A
MGGTSTDVALVDGQIQPSSQSELAGLPVGVPMLDIHTVGAGGGSLARFDAAGALRVGPESAGADPGPICYRRGTLPTVTDANLLLGRLQPDHFLGGEFRLDLERTRHLVEHWLEAQRLTMSLDQFAVGVVRVVNASMEKAIRVVSIERGYDPREFVLVAYGGAGGLHACELAQSLGIPRVIVPALPGALSAYGILVSNVVKDFSQTVLWRVGMKLPTEKLQKQFASLRTVGHKELRIEGWTGVIREQLSLDVRYRGQGYELNVPFSPQLAAEFHRMHACRYGYSHPEREIELVTLRLRLTISSADSMRKHSRPQVARIKPAPTRHSRSKASVVFDGVKSMAEVWDRDGLRAGEKHRGPAIVAEYSATTLIPPDKRFWVDPSGNLSIEITA